MRICVTSLVALTFVVATLVVSAPVPAQSSGADPSSMSIEELDGAANEMVKKMEERLTLRFQLLEQSISSSDVAATAIRTEAITAIKGLVKLSEENYMTLQQKRAEKDRDGEVHEYVKISIAAAKVAELYAQVKTASGIDVDLESTQVESTLDIESSIPVDTETFSGFGTEAVDVIPDPPSHASPTF